MLKLGDAELAELIRPAGYFNVKAKRLKHLCAFLRAEGAMGRPERLRERAPLPELRRRLLAVHGIGEETADSILLYALGLPSFVVDAYTRRIFGRLGLLAGDEGYRDMASYRSATSGVTVSLYHEDDGPQHTGGAGTDRLEHIEGLIGSAFNDILIGGSGPNTLRGGAGDHGGRGPHGHDRAAHRQEIRAPLRRR